MAALPYIQLYVADYLADTMHLSTEEHGAYLLVIMNYWQTGKPIPEKRIQAITRIGSERLTDVTEALREFFNIDETGLWHHSRIDRELEKVRDKSRKASLAGRKSAQIRWGSGEKVTDVIADVTKTLQHKDNHTDTDTDTDTNKKKNIKKQSTAFIPPVTSDVAKYCKQRKNSINAQQFVDHYTANGWMRGKTKIRDWKACVRTWEQNSNDTSLPTGRDNRPRLPEL